MRRCLFVLATASLVLGLTACSSGTSNLFGTSKRAPDEFAVYSRAPLSLPPGYGSRPVGANALPAPGGAPGRIVSQQPQLEAREALLAADGAAAAPRGGVTPVAAGVSSGAPASPGVRALYQKTGADRADPEIRSIVNRETQLLAEADQTFIERLMFWKTPVGSTSVVDAPREARRIQENQALGEPVVIGPTPTIERRPKGALEGILQGIF